MDFKFWLFTAIIAPAVFDESRRAGLSSSVVEQRTCNAQVVSSILTGGSRSFASQYYLSTRGVKMQNNSFPHAAFSEELSANSEYIKSFKYSGLTGVAQKGLAIVTCMDSRISPLAIVGMQPGDVKILRNAGARVTDDVLRTLVLATFLLGVKRVLVMPHTECKMASATEPEIHDEIMQEFGVDTRSVEIRTVRDTLEALKTDVTRIRTYPLLAAGVTVGGAIYDVHTGALTPIDI